MAPITADRSAHRAQLARRTAEKDELAVRPLEPALEILGADPHGAHGSVRARAPQP